MLTERLRVEACSTRAKTAAGWGSVERIAYALLRRERLSAGDVLALLADGSSG